jgi:hypothetical protein
MNMMAKILIIVAFLLLLVSVPVWLAIRVKRHPEKDRNMRRIKELQRGAEFEEGVQKFYMVNYLSTGIGLVLAALLELVFGMDKFLAIMIPTFGVCMVLIIAKWRFIGELNKVGLVASAIWLVVMITYLTIF